MSVNNANGSAGRWRSDYCAFVRVTQSVADHRVSLTVLVAPPRSAPFSSPSEVNLKPIQMLRLKEEIILMFGAF